MTCPGLFRTMLGLALGVLIGFSSPASAVVLTTATFDTDSYVFAGTNAAASTEITLGALIPLGQEPHYNIGFLTFDVSGLSPTGPKYLELEANTVTGQLPSTVGVGTLDAPYTDYFAATAPPPQIYLGRQNWLHAHAYNTPQIGTLTFSGAGKQYLDVTSVVNGWIANPATNFGFALWRIGGADFTSPELFSMNDPQGRGPALNSVPEPSSMALGAFAAIAMIVVRYRQKRFAIKS